MSWGEGGVGVHNVSHIPGHTGVGEWGEARGAPDYLQQK